MTDDFDVVVLAGGAARRLGGVDKPALEVGGVTLLDRVLLATASARTTVVVGPRRPTACEVQWAWESPPGGGPLAALAAGLELVTAGVVVLLAADLPFVTEAAVLGLVAQPFPEHGRVVHDGGRPQWLCSAWRTAELRRAFTGAPVQGMSLRSVLGQLTAEQVPVDPQGPRVWEDVDTEDDVRRARAQAEGTGD